MEENARQMPWIIASLCILTFIVIALIFEYTGQNSTRITELNRQYLEDAAAQAVKNMDNMLRNATNNIDMVAFLYSVRLTGPSFDLRELDQLSGKTPFDYFRFIDTKGTVYLRDGTSADVSARTHYKEGIKGKTGVDFIPKPVFSADPALIFYSPLYYKGKIIGILNGFLSADTLAKLMSNSYFGEPAKEYLCKRDGMIAAVYGENTSKQNFIENLAKSDTVTPEILAEVRESFRTGKSCNFVYKENAPEANAFITSLTDDKWMLVKTFPAIVGTRMTSRANRDALQLEIKLLIACAFYCILMGAWLIGQNRRLRRKSQNYGQIIDSVRQLYSRFIVVDLKNDTYECMEGKGITGGNIPSAGTYSGLLAQFKTRCFRAEDIDAVDKNLIGQGLQDSLLHEGFVQYEYGQDQEQERWEKLSLIKLDIEKKEIRKVLIAVEDVTALKQEEQAKRKALEIAFHSAEAANSAKSDFLSRMSHDIRTPMNAIIGLTAIAGTHLDDHDRIVDCLGKITSSSKHLLSLINEILDMSKIESGKFQLSEAPFHLSDLLDELIDMVRPSLRSRRLDFSVHTYHILHEDVIGDSSRLQQIFLNILSNAVKYTGEGGKITISITEKPSRQPLVSNYEFVFTDTGIGMSPEFLTRLFMPFERASDVQVAKIQGTGLGMAIAQELVRIMNGTISVKSELGKGSEFSVTVSLRIPEDQAVADEWLIGLPVLVVDDDPTFCESSCATLQMMGMEGESVLSGQDAIQLVTERHKNNQDFFAVILDWQMPGMNGLDTARAIRQEVGSEIPLVILSAYDWSDIESEARSVGINAFISKPIFQSKLRCVFKSFLQNQKEADAHPLKDMQEKDFSGKRVLLVDDNELNREIAAEILGMAGLTVESAENGKKAVDMIAVSPEHYYNMIFMDVQMPVMDGYQSTAAIRTLSREDVKKLPIVAMTANAFEEDVRTALAAGMDEHIAKPLDFDKLLQTLNRWL